MSIEETLKERGNRYGDFTDHARICQSLQDVMRDEPKDMITGVTGWEMLSPIHNRH